MSKLTAAQLKHLETTFKKKDLNKDGHVTVEEFKEAFNYLSPEDLKQLLEIVNPDNDDEISFEEFLLNR